MSTYKVIQDIEAEDKLVGPLSLRQFIYAGIGAFLGYMNFLCVAKGAPILLIGFVPPMLFCFFFAWPWSPDQPTEVWALAKIRFYFKPRRRIWDQSGVKELVTITVPKRIEKVFTNGLSQTEVKSRLGALADTIDSRGWVIKNSKVNLSTTPQYGALEADSDRLVSYATMPQEVSDLDVQEADDILDEQHNPVAHQFDEMISASAKAHREQIVEKLRSDSVPAPAAPAPQQDYWFLKQTEGAPGQASSAAAGDVVFAEPQTVQPGTTGPVGPVAADPTAAEEAMAASIKSQNAAQQQTYSHLKNIQPAGQAQVAPAPVQNPVPAAGDAAILNLAGNNDLNVATIAREANKARNPESSDDEVVISLH